MKYLYFINGAFPEQTELDDAAHLQGEVNFRPVKFALGNVEDLEVADAVAGNVPGAYLVATTSTGEKRYERVWTDLYQEPSEDAPQAPVEPAPTIEPPSAPIAPPAAPVEPDAEG